MLIMFLPLAIAASGDADEGCGCAHMSAEIAGLKEKLDTFVSITEELQKRLARFEQLQVKPITREGEARRALSHGGSSHYVTVDAKEVHEFPSSGSCQPGSHARLVAKDRQGVDQWLGGVNDASTDVSLVSVSDTSTSPWTTNTIQTNSAPFKILHDPSCSSAPTLHLPLDTVADGTFSIGSTDVGATLTSLQASLSGGSSPTWTDAPLFSNGGYTVTGYKWSGGIDASFAPQYLIKDGIVYMRGCAGRTDGADLTGGTTLLIMPAEARPPSPSWPNFIVASSHSSACSDCAWWSMVSLTASNGAFSLFGSSSRTETTDFVCFDGVFYRSDED